VAPDVSIDLVPSSARASSLWKSTRPATKHHFPEDLNPGQHRCKHLKNRTFSHNTQPVPPSYANIH